MKKRIFAASMASVMALSSVSVVAFADETKADFGEAVTKAELKEYVKGFDSFLKEDVYEYGTNQADQLQNAVDYAENVVADADATEEDCTAAYQMLKSVFESLEKHTAEELQVLIDDYKSIKDTENILNEDLNDNIYPQDKYDAFVGAYDAAESYVNSEDGRLITDAFIDLEKAKKDLEPLDFVTKKDFRAVLKEYENIATKLKSYETWRRGTVSVNPETGTNFTDSNPPKKKLSDAYYVTFGDLYKIVCDSSNVVLEKSINHEVLNSASYTWIDTDGGTVKGFVEGEYESFDKIQSSVKTTDDGIVRAYKAAKEAVEVFKSWKADDTNRAAKANINTVVSKYRAELVRDYCSDSNNGMTKKIFDAIGVAAKLPAYTAGETEWKTADEITLILDKDTNLIVLGSDGKPLKAVADATKQYEKKIAKDQDIMKYIPVLSSEVATNTGISNAVTYANAKKDATAALIDFDTKVEEFKLKLNALTAAKAAVDAIDTTGFNGTGTPVNLAAITDPEDGTTEVFAADTTTADSYTGEDAYNDAVTAYKTAYQAASDAATAASNAKSTLDSANSTFGNLTAPSNKDQYGVELANMLAIAEKYNDADAISDKDQRKAGFKKAYDSDSTSSPAYVGLDVYDNNNIVAEPAGSRNEYTLINRNLTYALEDLYLKDEETKYKTKDVQTLIDEAYDLCDKTGDSEVFSQTHLAVVDARKVALDWLTTVKATKDYKEGDPVDGNNATSMYNYLDKRMNDLRKQYAAYPMSYGEIAELIATVGEGLDDGAYKNADAIKVALAKVAVGLSTLDAKEDQNQPFNYDREFISYNRLLTSENASKIKPNDAEKALYKDIQALEKAIEDDQKTDPDVVLGDADGDGVLTPKDAAQILKAYAQLVTLTDAQKKAADFNKDGNVDAKDALAILKSLAGIKE